MAFSVINGSPQDPNIRRLNRVMQRSLAGKRFVAVASVFACKKTAGTSLYSAHAFGKAVDFMLRAKTRTNADRLRRAVVRHSTKRTIANLGRPVKGINFVIGGVTQWNRGEGDSAYGGVPHDNHVHAATMGSTTVRPPCA